MKESRWYEMNEDGTVSVYDSPYPENAKFCSVVQKKDLPYYRTNFKLNLVWRIE